MFLQFVDKIIVSVQSVFNLKTIEATADICVAAITFYSAYLKFICKKVVVLLYTEKVSMFHGLTYSVILENKSLSTIAVSKVNIIFKDKYALEIANPDEPFILEPYKPKKIMSDTFANTLPFATPEINNVHNDIVVMLDTSKGTIYARVPRETKWYKKLIEKIRKQKTIKVTPLMPVKESFNGIAVSTWIKYILVYRSAEGEQHTVLIHQNGRLHKDVLGISSISAENMINVETISEFFKDLLSKYKYHFISVDKRNEFVYNSVDRGQRLDN